MDLEVPLGPSPRRAVRHGLNLEVSYGPNPWYVCVCDWQIIEKRKAGGEPGNKSIKKAKFMPDDGMDED